ncbi:hypothetical protein [Novipirellula caenicola]|uniref:hypothetical protein n=1 Tax=Novipirellula caenicola TaxID=1536901 RepID=UPI0031F0A35A
MVDHVPDALNSEATPREATPPTPSQGPEQRQAGFKDADRGVIKPSVIDSAATASRRPSRCLGGTGMMFM